MMLLRKPLISGALLAAVIWSGSSSGAILPGNADGWYTWQIEAPDASTTMCCYSRLGANDPQPGCDLDSRNLSFSNNVDCTSVPGDVQVYVRMVKGIPTAIRVLSSNCPATAASSIEDHGLVSAAENVSWFKTVIEDRRLDKDVREAALFALLQSNSDEAYVYIDNLLSRN